MPDLMWWRKYVWAMRSSLSVILALIGLLSCTDRSEPNVLIQEPMSVAEIQDFVASIKFVGEIAPGVSVDFVPNELTKSYAEGFEFTEMGDPNFTRLGPTFNVSSSSTNESRLIYTVEEISLKTTVTFSYTEILTLGELARRYPEDVAVSPNMENWVLGIAFGNRLLSLDDLTENTVDDILQVTDFLEVLIDPSDSDLEGIYYFQENEVEIFNPPLSLGGDYTLGQNSLRSRGLISIDHGFSIPTLLGPYSLILEE